MKDLFTTQKLKALKELVLKKKVLLPALAILLLIVIAVGYFGGARASIIEVIGNVSVTRKAKTSAAKAGYALKNNDFVTAEESSGAWIRLDEYKTVLLCGPGELRLESVKKDFILRLEAGSMLVRLEKALKTGESFDILVGALRLEARDGAVFSVQLETPDNATLNVYHGEVTVYGTDGQTLTVLKKGLSIGLNPEAGTIEGEAKPIDYNALPGMLLEYVQDYARQAVQETSGVATPTESGLEPELEPESEPEEEPYTPETLPEGEAGEAPVPEGPALPDVKFRYVWSGAEFKPRADISWFLEGADYILWQAFDEKGDALTEGVQLNNIGDGIRLTDYVFEVSSPMKNGLYPMGCTLRLTPYLYLEDGADSQPLTPIVMDLPYFEVEAQGNGTQLSPVISTNVGFYFVHSHGSLTDTVQGGKLRIRGSFMPIEGQKVPINIDVLSK